MGSRSHRPSLVQMYFRKNPWISVQWKIITTISTFCVKAKRRKAYKSQGNSEVGQARWRKTPVSAFAGLLYQLKSNVSCIQLNYSLIPIVSRTFFLM